MAYVVFARKYRPQTFAEVVAQEHVTQTLVNALSSGKISHAYLFSGPRGTGKTTTARILAKALNCVNGPTPEPCNTCGFCQEITSGQSLDVVEIDAASNSGVDDVRTLRENIRYTPAGGKYRVYIIDEVHMLSGAAFNALLKTLEEPPVHSVFVLATTELHKVPATIVSRCQRFDFRRIPFERLSTALTDIAVKEHLAIDADAVALVAKKAEGSLRDGLSLLDQLVAFAGERITRSEVEATLGLIAGEVLFEITDAIAARDEKQVLSVFQKQADAGADLKQFLDDLLEHFRNLLIARTAGDKAELFALATAERERYVTAAQTFAEGDLLRMLSSLGALKTEFDKLSQPRIFLELELVKLARLDRTVEIANLIRRLEGGSMGGRHPTNAPLELLLGETTEQNPPRRSGSPTANTSVPVKTSSALEKEVATAIPVASVKNFILDDIRRGWPTFVEKLRAEKPTLAAILYEGKAAQVEGNIVTVEVPNGQKFHLQMLEKRENLRLVEEILSTACGIPPEAGLRVKISLAEKAAAEVSEKPSAGKRGEEIPEVKQLIEKFDAEVIDRRPVRK